MIALLLVIGYTLLFAYLFSKWRFIQNSQLDWPLVQLAFISKVVFSLLYGWLHLHYIYGIDTHTYVKYGLEIYNTLWDNPLHYLELVFGPSGERPPPAHLKATIDKIEHWTNGRSYAMLRINALLGFFSFGCYWVHAVFFACFSFIGSIGLYRTFLHFFPTKKWTIYGLIFAMPAIVFWGSGVNKESVILFLVGSLLYQIVSWLQQPKKITRWIIISVCLLGLIGIRPHVFLLLFAALVPFIWTSFYKKWTLSKYTISYLVMLIGVLLASNLSPKLNFLNKIADLRFHYVKYYTGNSDLDIELIRPTFLAIVQDVPAALYRMTLAPLAIETTTFFRLLGKIETVFLLLLVLVGLYCNRFWRYKKQLPFLYFCLFFTLSYFILTGLIVNNIGAIVRYRSIFLPLFLAFFLLPISIKVDKIEEWKNKVKR